MVQEQKLGNGSQCEAGISLLLTMQMGNQTNLQRLLHVCMHTPEEKCCCDQMFVILVALKQHTFGNNIVSSECRKINMLESDERPILVK